MKDSVEYAKSARSSCKSCGVKIDKGTVRIGRVSKGDGGFDMTRWYHPRCYVKTSTDTESASLEQLQGLSILKPKDKDALQQLVEAAAGAKRKAGETGQAGEEGQEGKESKRKRGEEVDGEQEVKPVYGESKEEEGEVEAYDRAAWEKVLDGFSPKQLSSSYKGANLPAGWTAFHTVILGEGKGVPPSEKIAAFDFDGCLANTNVRRHGADAWSLLFPSVPSKLREYHQQGYKLVIFTNESNIDRFTKARQKAVDSKLGRLEGLCAQVAVPIQVVIACAKSGERDACRKPGPGMWDLVERHLNGGVPVDRASSFFVGDAAGRPGDHSASDRDFAEAVGIKFLVPEDVFLESGDSL